MDSAPKVKSKALEVNLADYHVDVAVDPKYAVLQEVMSKYYGLMDGLNTFLRELSHPYLNWRFIVAEARKYALDYFHLFRQHPRGPDAARRMAEILIAAVHSRQDRRMSTSAAVDNLLLYLQTIVRDSDADFERFRPVVSEAFEQMHQLPEDAFDLRGPKLSSRGAPGGRFHETDPQRPGRGSRLSIACWPGISAAPMPTG